VLFVTRRMFGWRVKRVEAMPLIFDVWSIGEDEAHAAKNVDRAIEHLGEGMKRAALVGSARQRDVDVDERVRFFLPAKLFGAFFNCSGDGFANFVEQFPDDRTLCRAERFHLLAPRGDAAVAAKKTHPGLFERLRAGRTGVF